MIDENDKTKLTGSDIDDYYRRNLSKSSYKNRCFAGKRVTIDEYNGEKIHYSKINRYTKDVRQETTAHVDHIVPKDTIAKRYGEDLSKSQLKKIAQEDYNLAVTSARINQGKNALSNHEYLISQLKAKDKRPENAYTTYNMLKSEIVAEVSINTNVAVVKFSNNVGRTLELKKSFTNKISYSAGSSISKSTGAGTSAALMNLTVSSVNNLVMVASGQKDIDTAFKHIAKDTGSSFMVGTGLDMAQQAFAEIVKGGGSKEVLLKFNNGLPVAEITNTALIANSVIKFINDEIDFEECASEIVMNGVGMFAYSLGMTIGGPAGAIVVSYVSAQICNTVIEYRQMTELTEEKMRKVNSIAAQALIEMEIQRNELKIMIQEEYLRWDKLINSGFEKICISALSDDVDGIAQGLNELMSIFGKTVRYKTSEEFDEFFMDENAILTF